MERIEKKYFNGLKNTLACERSHAKLDVENYHLMPLQYCYTHDLQLGDFVDVKGVDQVLGYSNQDWTLEFYYSKIHPDDRGFVFESSKDNINSFNSHKEMLVPFGIQFTILFRVKKLDGTYAHIMRLSTILEAGESIIKTFSICTDVTSLSLYNRIEAQNSISLFNKALIEPMLDKRKRVKLQKLTKKENKILNMVAMGKSSKEIAHDIGVSVLTVSKHRQNIIKKTDVKSIYELVGELRGCVYQ